MDNRVDGNAVRRHFDSLAGDYDTIKKKNWYYSSSLKKFIAELIPPGSRVLEIGTATGEVLNYLKPSRGVGIDLSPKMIEFARAKFPHLEFVSASIDQFHAKERFDYILLADVIEHIENPNGLFRKLKELCAADTRVIITMANPAWEPLLGLLERLRFKMEEGPHYRVSEKETVLMAANNGFKLRSADRYLLFPVHIPLISAFANDVAGRLPLLRRLAVIVRFDFCLDADAAAIKPENVPNP